MGCSQSQSRDMYSAVTDGHVTTPQSGEGATWRVLDTQPLQDWAETGAQAWGFDTDVDYENRSSRLQPWATRGRHFEVLLPAPVNTEELDVKYSYEEMLIEETGSWTNCRIKLHMSYKPLVLHKYKYSPWLDVAQVIGCRDHVIVIQLVLLKVCQFLVVDMAAGEIIGSFENKHSGSACLWECAISPDFSVFVLKPCVLFLLKYNLNTVQDEVRIYYVDTLPLAINSEDAKNKKYCPNEVAQDIIGIHLNIVTQLAEVSRKKESNTLPVFRGSSLSFEGCARDVSLVFDPRYRYSRLAVSTVSKNKDATLGIYCLRTGEFVKQEPMRQDKLQSIHFSPCGYFIAASTTTYSPENSAFPKKIHFRGVNIYSSDTLALLHRIKTTGTVSMVSIVPGAIFPLFCHVGRYLATGSGSGGDVTRVNVYGLPKVTSLQHQCRLAILNIIHTRGDVMDMLPLLDDKLREYLKFNPTKD